MQCNAMPKGQSPHGAMGCNTLQSTITQQIANTTKQNELQHNTAQPPTRRDGPTPPTGTSEFFTRQTAFWFHSGGCSAPSVRAATQQPKCSGESARCRLAAHGARASRQALAVFFSERVFSPDSAGALWPQGNVVTSYRPAGRALRTRLHESRHA